MKSIKIKKADLEDLEFIGELFNKYRIFYGQNSDLEASKKFIEERMINNESVIFIIMDGSIIPLGFVQLYLSFSSVSMQKTWILNDLYVEESARRKGIGKSLMNKAKEFAFETGAKGLTLSTSINNYNAQKLYEQSGYKRNELFYNYTYFFNKQTN